MFFVLKIDIPVILPIFLLISLMECKKVINMRGKLELKEEIDDLDLVHSIPSYHGKMVFENEILYCNGEESFIKIEVSDKENPKMLLSNPHADVYRFYDFDVHDGYIIRSGDVVDENLELVTEMGNFSYFLRKFAYKCEEDNICTFFGMSIEEEKEEEGGELGEPTIASILELTNLGSVSSEELVVSTVKIPLGDEDSAYFDTIGMYEVEFDGCRFGDMKILGMEGDDESRKLYTSCDPNSNNLLDTLYETDISDPQNLVVVDTVKFEQVDFDASYGYSYHIDLDFKLAFFFTLNGEFSVWSFSDDDDSSSSSLSSMKRLWVLEGCCQSQNVGGYQTLMEVVKIRRDEENEDDDLLSNPSGDDSSEDDFYVYLCDEDKVRLVTMSREEEGGGGEFKPELHSSAYFNIPDSQKCYSFTAHNSMETDVDSTNSMVVDQGAQFLYVLDSADNLYVLEVEDVVDWTIIVIIIVVTTVSLICVACCYAVCVAGICCLCCFIPSTTSTSGGIVQSVSTSTSGGVVSSIVVYVRKQLIISRNLENDEVLSSTSSSSSNTTTTDNRNTNSSEEEEGEDEEEEDEEEDVLSASSSSVAEGSTSESSSDKKYEKFGKTQSIHLDEHDMTLKAEDTIIREEDQTDEEEDGETHKLNESFSIIDEEEWDDEKEKNDEKQVQQQQQQQQMDEKKEEERDQIDIQQIAGYDTKKEEEVIFSDQKNEKEKKEEEGEEEDILSSSSSSDEVDKDLVY